MSEERLDRLLAGYDKLIADYESLIAETRAWIIALAVTPMCVLAILIAVAWSAR